MADSHTSILSVYYGRQIHLNTVCVLWQTDTHQYSLCIMADRHTSIQSVFYGRQIHLNSLCIMAVTPKYSLCIMVD